MKTYALLVGLDQYQDKRIPTLHGCVNDVSRFESYLKTTLNVPNNQVLKLTDRQATKTAVVSAFQKHLAQATKDDVAIFYFAGHGIKQHANPVFKASALNDALECMTCFDTTLTGGNLIADKELRWLIHQLSAKTNSHILTIFDCCHSGDNTRSVGEETKLQERCVKHVDERKGPFIMPQRPWSEFIFSKTVSEKDVETKDLDAVLPQGTHIQLAACASNETAKEKDGRGLFSKYILELLEASGGKMSYFDLRSLSYRRMSSFPPENRQTPQFYAVGTSLFQSFLGGAPQTEVQANVSFSTDRNQWEMSMGEIYGIQKDEKVFVTLPHKNNEVEAAVVEEVFLDYSVLSFDIEKYETNKKPEDKRVRHTDNYKCTVGKFMQKEISVACVSETAVAAWNKYAKSRAELLENARIKPVETTAKPDYVLNTEGGKIFIADPKAPACPLVEMIDNNGDAAFEEIKEQLESVTRWNYAKAQKTKADSDSLFDNIEISFEHDGKSDDLKKMGKATCSITGFKTYEAKELYGWNQLSTIKITNTHPTNTIYIAGQWLSEFFGIDCSVIGESPIAIPFEAGKTTYVFKKEFRFTFRDHVFYDKWDKFSNYLKIYVSTSPFEITQFQQADLERPRKGEMRSKGEEAPRGAIREPEETVAVPQWAIKTIEFEIDTSRLV